MLLSQLGKGEVPSKTGVVVVDNRSYGTLNLTLYRREDAISMAFFHILERICGSY
jgi:hypothetical protein